METTFTLRKDELDADFLESVKRLFRNNQELQITITSATDFGLTQPETKDAYFARLEQAARNLEVGQNQIVMTDDDFDAFSLRLLK
jgi:hypothetical protein